MSRSSGILSLSIEILVEILSYLHYLDLVRCQQVSQSFRTLIHNTPALEYALELGLTGYNDGCTGNSVVQRLETLRRTQHAWRVPRPKRVLTAAVPSQDWVEARWSKDVLVGRVPTDARRLDVFHLGSEVRDADRSKTIHFDVDFDAACVDPGQDLVVLTRAAFAPNNGGYRPPPKIYLRSLSDHGPHPRAKQDFIDLAGYGFSWAPFARRLRAQISGEFLTVSVYKQLMVDAVLVWHWPSGTINAALRPTSYELYLSTYCTTDGLLLVNRHRRRPSTSFGIYVYVLDPAEETPRLCAAFGLPALQWDPSSLLSSAFYPRYNRHGATNGASSSMANTADSTPGCVLVQLRIDLQYTLYVPLSVLQDVVEAQGGLSRVEPVDVPWAKWAHRARLVEENAEAPIVCGYRVVYPDHILDFAPYSVATDAYAAPRVAANDDDGDDQHVDESEVVVSASILRANLFAEPVVTSLPYRRTTLSLPSLTQDMVQVVLEEASGPKVIRATCKDFVLVPTLLEVFSI